MPDFFLKIKEAKKNINVFPISKNWLDIGNPNDLDFARKKFSS